jgi:hypothetical protein
MANEALAPFERRARRPGEVLQYALCTHDAVQCDGVFFAERPQAKPFGLQRGDGHGASFPDPMPSMFAAMEGTSNPQKSFRRAATRNHGTLDAWAAPGA